METREAEYSLKVKRRGARNHYGIEMAEAVLRVAYEGGVFMAFGDLIGKAKEMTSAVADTAGKFLDEFNEALPTMRALGFTIRDFRMSMGLTPEAGAKLIASVDTIDVEKLNDLIARHRDKKLLVALLKALQAAYHIKEQLGENCFRSVEMDVTLGLSPHISVGFGRVEAATAVAAAHA